MKNHEIDAPVSTLRRKLLLGLPSGLALSTPLALIGCGGGGDAGGAGTTSTADDEAVKALAARLPAFDRTAIPIVVSLPAGSGVSVATTNVVTANNVSQVGADGSGGAVLLGNAPQMAYVFDAAGRLLLMGVIEPGANTALDSRTTAEALVLLASEAALQGEAMELAMRETLRSHAIAEPVRLAVEAAAARAGIDESDAALMTALETAVRALRVTPAIAPSSTGRKHALGVDILPQSAQSGVTVERTDDYNTVLLRNTFRRRTHAWVSRIGYFDAVGNAVQLPAPVAVKDFDLSGTTALSFDNLVISIGDYLAELAKDIGFIGAYERGNGWWNPVTSAPVSLAVEPGTATVSVYRTRVVGIGTSDGLPMTGDEAAKLEQILGATLWEDICLPLIKTLILPMISARVGATYEDEFKKATSALLLTATADLVNIEVSGSYFPATVAALRKGDAKEMLAQFFIEFFSSNTWGSILETGLKAMVLATPVSVLPVLRDGNGNIIGVNLLPEQDLIKANVAKLSASLTKLARIITIVKVVTTAGDYAAMAKDWSSSSRLDEFTLNVSTAKISLTPDPLLVDGVAVSAAVTAKVEGLDAALTADNVFLQWKCSAKYGDLYKRGGNETNEFESLLANPAHDYIPNGTKDDPAVPDTIEVTAFYRNTTTNKRIEMGSVTVPVKFTKAFNLTISPPGLTVFPTDTDMVVTAFFKEKLPAGSTVAWTWSHAGAGSIVALPTDSNPADSKVKFQSGSADGSATVTARATIDIPVTATTPSAVVIADPVSTTFTVKKGLTTITFEAGGGVFGCTDPLACGVSEYTAFIVPRFSKAVLYRAVLSGYAYASCNRTVAWTAPLGDGGGCNFPVSYYPHSSAGATDAWAVWIGFGGPISGKCVVTVTLAP